MKIVFFGTPEFAVPSLKMLTRTNGVEVLSVITQPDQPVGRKQQITPPPVKKAAIELHLPVFQPKNKQELAKITKDIKADFFIVIAYGMIIPEEILNIPKHGSINIHASLLPKYRGASPIQESLLHGDQETGVTIMKMDKELDHGDIYFIKRIPILESDSLEPLSEKLSELSSFILPLVLRDIELKRLNPIPQNHQNATFCHKIEKEDGKIDWNKSAEEIKNMVRAYTPWPSVYTDLKGKKIKILQAITSADSLTPGEISIEGSILKIGTKKGCLVPEKIQLEGKSPMHIKDFLNGYRQILNGEVGVP